MRLSSTLLAIGTLTVAGAVAKADTFAFSFGASGDAITGSGVLTGTLLDPGSYTVTAIQGTTSYPGSAALAITALLTPGDYGGNDNLLLTSSDGLQFDGDGISYELSDGTDVNVYTDPVFGDAESFQTSDFTLGSEYSSYAVAPTPEPGSFLLLGTGLMGALGLARNRRRT